jgi:hypothetical protein
MYGTAREGRVGRIKSDVVLAARRKLFSGRKNEKQKFMKNEYGG